MSLDRRLLALIGKRFPAIFDVIPRGPQSHLAHQFINDRLSAAALNPQPLPPQQLGAAIAAEVIQMAFMASRTGQRPGVAFEVLDDWCPTVPKRLKLPIWWPPIPEPEPHPDWFVDFHLGFATRLAVAASAAGGSPLGEMLDKAVDRSIAVIQGLNAAGGVRA